MPLLHPAMRKVLLILSLMAVVSLAVAADLEAGHAAYVIHDGQALLTDKDPDSAVLEKLKTHHAYTIVQISGNWAQVKGASTTGWIYQGNLSREEPPDVNTSSFKTQASETSLNAAARGLDDDAKAYASRKDEAESANDVVWMEKQNDVISKADVRAYMKEHKLGEYGGGQ